MISVICPVYNEIKYIDKLILFLIKVSPLDKEIIFIDGGSTDGTVEAINKYMETSINIRFLFNPKKYVPFALNLAIKQSSGNPIIRIDAHTEYAEDYFDKIIQSFELSGADIVGGPMIKIGISDFQKAVAFCTSSIFGIGNSKIHKINYEGFSDHVYLGAWKRDLFNDIGYFDLRMKRNQDDEFHYRAKSFGKKIFLSSNIKSYYHPRPDFKLLFKQYFQYGLYKPLVLIKIKSEIKLRHLIPSVFFVYIFLSPLYFFVPALYIPFLLYILINFYYSLKSNYNTKIRLLSIMVFITIHLAYGSGFIVGLFNSFKQINKRYDDLT